MKILNAHALFYAWEQAHAHYDLHGYKEYEAKRCRPMDMYVPHVIRFTKVHGARICPRHVLLSLTHALVSETARDLRKIHLAQWLMAAEA